MRKTIGLLMLVFCVLVGCQSTPTPTPTSIPMVTPTSPKQPIELKPIEVEISGLPENVFVSIHVSKPPSSQSIIQAERDTGVWKLDLPLYCDFCVVTANVSGYTSTPISYTIKIIDGNFQVYDADNKTMNRAVFTFTATP
jgi:hypothetical protein